jgi:tetratricopeptide (TPR) repeat protein
MAITLGCDDPDVFEIRGQCYDQIGQYKLAAIDFTRALELAPDRHFDYYHRANVFRKGKQYLAAKQDYQKILSVSSNSKLVDLAQTRLQDISDLVDVDTSAPPLAATATSVVEPKDQTTKETPRVWGWLQRIGKKHRQEGI